MEPQLDLSACEREPIHIPGAVQPHGALLVVDPQTLAIEQAGGACAPFFGTSAAELIGKNLRQVGRGSIAELASASLLHVDSADARAADGSELDVLLHHTGGKLILEFEAAPKRRKSAVELARLLDTIGARFAAARTRDELTDLAAAQFRSVTGFDRVMIYRFLPDGSGSVVAEDVAEDMPAFLNHRYPASDIPRQARELYVRNVIRVIPDVHYSPCPLMAADRHAPPLDMSDCHLRSVSPVHVQYLKNMDVGSSASMSIIRDGALWGLVACHHRSAKALSYEERAVCRTLAGVLSHHVARLDEADLYKERARTRAAEDEFLQLVNGHESVLESVERHISDLMHVIPAHGVALRNGDRVALGGYCPPESDVLALADWLLQKSDAVFHSAHLSADYPPAAAFTSAGSGLLATRVAGNGRQQFLWFRAEQIELVNWAGNPHKPVEDGASPGVLTPRRSFDLWQETVRGRAEPWGQAEIEAAERLSRRLADLQRHENLSTFTDTLKKALDERDSLIKHHEYLRRESDHRIQNNLQIVANMLSMQMRGTSAPEVRSQLEEALSRVNAVALVHRRLYRSDEPKSVNLDSYVRDLLGELGRSLGGAWGQKLRPRTAPITVATDVAMSIGVIISELVLNAVKYAYGGHIGPIDIDVSEHGERVQVAVRDYGRGATAAVDGGFGTKLIKALVERIHGKLEHKDADPGLRVMVTVPLGASGPLHA